MFYYLIKTMILGMKWLFKNKVLHILGLRYRPRAQMAHQRDYFMSCNVTCSPSCRIRSDSQTTGLTRRPSRLPDNWIAEDACSQTSQQIRDVEPVLV